MPCVDEQLRVLHTVTARLEQAGLPYMVSGSTALAVYGTPRMTRVIDMVVALRDEDVGVVCAAFESDFDCDAEALADAVIRRSLFNLIHLETLFKVDLIILKATEYRTTEFARRREIVVAGKNVWFVAPEDLVLSKLLWAKDSHSELQLRDVATILRSGVPLDATYLSGPQVTS